MQQLQIWQSLNWIQYKPHKGGFREENELLSRSETNRPSADSTTILWECWFTASGLLQVVGDTTGVDKSTVPHNADAILETITVLTHEKLHYGILIAVITVEPTFKRCHFQCARKQGFRVKRKYLNKESYVLLTCGLFSSFFLFFLLSFCRKKLGKAPHSLWMCYQK